MKQRKTIHIFRHGETDWNAQGRFQGHIDIPLNDRGREQARQLIGVLKGKGIETVLSSDLGRAVETGRIVADAIGVPMRFDPRLREAHLGDAQGLTWQEIHQRFGTDLPGRWRSSLPTDADVSYPGGETGAQVLERVLEALREHLGSSEHSRFGVSTHGGVIRRLMHHLLPPGSGPVPIPNGVVYELSYDLTHGEFRLEGEVEDAD